MKKCKNCAHYRENKCQFWMVVPEKPEQVCLNYEVITAYRGTKVIRPHKFITY